MAEQNDPRSLVLLCAGVENYDQVPIPKVGSDLASFWDVMHRAIGCGRVSPSSFCRVDLRADEFRRLLEGAAPLIDKGANIVCCFSGHGAISGESLVLKFDDGTNQGSSVSMDAIREILASFKEAHSVLVVLDCCYSGGAANSLAPKTVFQTGNMALIASTSPLSATKIRGGASFLKRLSIAVEQLASEGGEVSVSRIVQRLRKNGYTDTYVMFPRGRDDLVLLDDQLQTNREFVEVLVDYYGTTTRDMRIPIMFGLAELNDGLIADAIERLAAAGLREAHWLNRRAVGSALSSIGVLGGRKREIGARLIRSNSWIDRCVGLIGLRNELDHSTIRRLFAETIQNSRYADDWWIALLYLADFKPASAWDVALRQEKIVGTTWGALEIWERCARDWHKKRITGWRKAAELLARVPQSERLGVIVGIDLLDMLPKDPVPTSFPYSLKRARAICRRIRSVVGDIRYEPRGPRRLSGALKFLDSLLYGSWRGSSSRTLGHLIDAVPASRKDVVISVLRSISVVGIRMSLVDKLIRSTPESDRDRVAAQCIESEPHPWVIRAALEVLLEVRKPTDAPFRLPKPIEFASHKRHQLPGSLDLALVLEQLAAKSGHSASELRLCDRYSSVFSESERNALKQDGLVSK